MASNLDNLNARKAAIIAAIANLTPYQIPDLPDADGMTFQEYIDKKWAEVERINGLIAAEAGPWEVQVKGQT